MDKLKFTRKELYDYVWEKPLSSLIKTYNISYSELKSLFEKFDIPVPLNGHWSKLKAGYQVNKIPLSTKFKYGDVIEYTPKEKRKPKEKISLPSLDEAFTQPTSLKPDKLILEAQKIYDKEFKRSSGDQLQYLGYLTLNISVSSGMISRAFNFMDVLIKYIRNNNGDIQVESHHTWVIIDSERFSVHLREKQNRIKKEKKEGYSWIEYDYKPSGILIFKVGEESWKSKEWKDGSNLIESQLSNIIEHLKTSAQGEKERRINQEKIRIEEAEQRQIQMEFEKRRTIEIANFSELNDSFEQWQKAQNMRIYLKEFEKIALEKGKIDNEFSEWLKLANEKIDWYDPLVGKEDELLKDVDKNTLTIKKKSYW